MKEKIELITKYEQIAKKIEEKINLGEFIPGTKLPSERKLAEEYGISNMTVNKALSLLVAKGLLKREHGNGTFVIRRNDIIGLNVVVLIISTDIHNHPLFYPILPDGLQANTFFPLILNISSPKLTEKIKELVKIKPKSIIFERLINNIDFKKLKEIENNIFLCPPNIMKNRDNEHFNFIYCDYEYAGYIGMKTLFENKRKKILVLSWERKKGNLSDLFLKGCEKCLKEYGEKLFFVVSDYMNENNYEELIKKERFDGILSFGDFRIIPVLKVLQKLSIKVPEDMQIIGTFNTPWAEIYDITSISINQKEILKEILECLKENKRGIIKKVLPYIFFRSSCPNPKGDNRNE
ncbi:MAG: GntR family transcriptional regulator [Candidatus Ratteibacteria bacterium]